MEYCPESTWLIFKTENIGEFYTRMADSTSFFNAIPSFQPIAEGLTTLLEPMAKSPVGAHFFVSGNPAAPQFTFATEKKNVDGVDFSNRHLAENTVFAIVSSAPIASYCDAETVAKIQLSAKGTKSTELAYISNEAIVAILTSTFNSNFGEIIKDEFSGSEWLAAEMSIEGLFSATAMLSQGRDESNRPNTSHLLRALPSDVDAALLVGSNSQVFAIVSCPYQQYPKNPEDNLFILLQSNDSIPAQDLTIQSKALDNSELAFIPYWAKQAFAITLGNTTVYGASKEQVERYMNDYVGFNRLKDTKVMQRMEEYISDAAFTFFVRTPSKQSQSAIFQEIGSDNRINSFILQGHSELAHQKLFSICAIHNETIKDELPEIWSATLDKEVLAGPWSFKNHYTQDGEVLVQDKLNQLYLINKDGKILWKKQLDQPIQGDVQIIDAFRSGKYQMLFATLKRLHLIDRNGNNVEGFPIKFDGENSVAPAAIAYTKGGELRILINDGTTLINYDVNGKKVNGWKSPNLGAPLAQPVQFLSYSGKDYLMAICTNNTVMLYDRTGGLKSEAIIIPEHIGDISFIERGSLKECQLIACDSIGNELVKTLDGQLSKEAFLPASNELKFTCNSRGDHAMVAVLENHLWTFDNAHNLLIDHLFSENISDIKWIWRERSWILLAEKESNEIIIVDASKGILDKMPVIGSIHSAVIDLENKGVRALVTHTGNGRIVAYRLSY